LIWNIETVDYLKLLKRDFEKINFPKCEILRDEELREIYNGLSYIKVKMKNDDVLDRLRQICTYISPFKSVDSISSVSFYKDELIGGICFATIMLDLRYFGKNKKLSLEFFIYRFMMEIGRYLYRTGNYENFKFKQEFNNILYNTEEDFIDDFCNDYKYCLDNKLTARI
jgi:hypothetical protein